MKVLLSGIGAIMAIGILFKTVQIMIPEQGVVMDQRTLELCNQATPQLNKDLGLSLLIFNWDYICTNKIK